MRTGVGPQRPGVKVLLTGASGFIGRHVAQVLRGAGYTVLPVSRHHGVDMAKLDEPRHWLARLEGVGAVVNAVGILAQTQRQSFQALHVQAPLALFEACVQAGVPRVVQLSALGADEAASCAYHLSKRTADEGLCALPLQAFVLRPSLVHGRGGYSSEWLLRLARLPIIPLPGKGHQRIQPVLLADVLATVLRCLQTSAPGRRLDVVGPEALSLAEWLQRLRGAQGLPAARLCPLPWPLVLAAARVGQHLLPLLHPDTLRMLQAGNVADVAPLAHFLGRLPRVASTQDLVQPWRFQETTP